MSEKENLVEAIKKEKTFFEYQDILPIIENNCIFLVNVKTKEKKLLSFYTDIDMKTKTRKMNCKAKGINFSITKTNPNLQNIDFFSIENNNQSFTMNRAKKEIKITLKTDEKKPHIYTIREKKVAITSSNGSFTLEKDETNNIKIPSIEMEYVNNFIREMLLLELAIPTITSYITSKNPLFGECIEKLQELREPDVKIYDIKRKETPPKQTPYQKALKLVK